MDPNNNQFHGKMLWKFYRFDDYGYVGGLFIATQDEVEACLGQRVFLSEACGKYGDREFILTRNMLQLVSKDPLMIHELELYLPVGYNPLEHITWLCTSCGDYCEPSFFDRESRCCLECAARFKR